ncbi:hypothetical protein [Allokutzneria albata]|uniref:hypothetical protein n=1 Tax=Allokutzneria albata TaxID=211114 RepID=UPI0012DD149A|nr:hypothetical protein [Allokutzneria albata]
MIAALTNGYLLDELHQRCGLNPDLLTALLMEAAEDDGRMPCECTCLNPCQYPPQQEGRGISSGPETITQARTALQQHIRFGQLRLS